MITAASTKLTMPLELIDVTTVTNAVDKEPVLILDGAKVTQTAQLLNQNQHQSQRSTQMITAASTKLTMPLELIDVTTVTNAVDKEPVLILDGAKVTQTAQLLNQN